MIAAPDVRFGTMPLSHRARASAAKESRAVMKSLRRLCAAAITTALLNLGLTGPVVAATRDAPDDVRSGGVSKQEATAVEYGLIIGIL